MQINWNDLRYLLALSREGTLSAVARDTGVDLTTVSRRLKALEQALGTQLFLRVDNRYEPTPALAAALEQAIQAEQRLNSFEAALSDLNSGLRGRVRITSIHNVINYYLLERLPAFYARYPDIELEIIADSSPLDLGRHEADLALRMGRPTQPQIVTRRLAQLSYAVYAHRALLHEAVTPETLPWVVLEDRYSSLPEAQWQRTHYPQVQTRLHCNVGPAMLSAVRSGIGAACLPCYMAQPCSELVALTGPVPMRELWLLVHPEKRTLARVRAVLDWLQQQLDQDRALFSGSSIDPESTWN